MLIAPLSDPHLCPRGMLYLLAKIEQPLLVALVHCHTEGEITPNPNLLCDHRLATNGIGASGRQHPVQHRRADGRLSLLSRKVAGVQTRANHHLVSTHCRFYQGPLAVAGCALSGQAPLFSDHCQMTITRCGRAWFTADHSRRARRDHHRDAIAVRSDGLVLQLRFLLGCDSLLRATREGRHAGCAVVWLIVGLGRRT